LLRFLGVFPEVIFAVFFLESFYSACGIDEFLFAGIEGVAHRADFCMYFLGGTAGLEGIAAATADYHLMIFRMYAFFHNIRFPASKLLHFNHIGRFRKSNF